MYPGKRMHGKARFARRSRIHLLLHCIWQRESAVPPDAFVVLLETGNHVTDRVPDPVMQSATSASQSNLLLLASGGLRQLADDNAFASPVWSDAGGASCL